MLPERLAVLNGPAAPLAVLGMSLFLISCSSAGAIPPVSVEPPAAPVAGQPPATPATAVGAFSRALENYPLVRVKEIADRRFTHEAFWEAAEDVMGGAAFEVEELGRSLHGLPIRAVSWGWGTTTVLLWSQMHGDESTATMALLDLMRYLAWPGDDPLRQRLWGNLRVTLVPMLNPDGAQRFQRRNAVGVDVNRDARELATPEARALKELRDRLQPDFGFNLHDQNAHTLAGRGGERVAFALLAPAYDRERSWNATRERARSVASVIAAVLEGEVPGRVARYDDTFNPRAFGDLMQQWGTSTVLIESGVLEGDPQKQRLRELNFAALVTALDAIARADLRYVDTTWYERLPTNAGFTHDVLITGARVVFPGAGPLRLDVALAWDDPIALQGLRLSGVGDLEGTYAYEVVDAEGLFLHPDRDGLTDEEGRAWLLVGEAVGFTLRRGPRPDSEVVRIFR